MSVFCITTILSVNSLSEMTGCFLFLLVATSRQGFEEENCVFKKKNINKAAFDVEGCLFVFLDCCQIAFNNLLSKLLIFVKTLLLKYIGLGFAVGFAVEGRLLSSGSVRLSTGRLFGVVSVYYFGVKPFVRGVWFALWRLCFCGFGFGMLLGYFGVFTAVRLLWVGLGRLG